MYSPHIRVEPKNQIGDLRVTKRRSQVIDHGDAASFASSDHDDNNEEE